MDWISLFSRYSKFFHILRYIDLFILPPPGPKLIHKGIEFTINKKPGNESAQGRGYLLI